MRPYCKGGLLQTIPAWIRCQDRLMVLFSSVQEVPFSVPLTHFSALAVLPRATHLEATLSLYPGRWLRSFASSPHLRQLCARTSPYPTTRTATAPMLPWQRGPSARPRLAPTFLSSCGSLPGEKHQKPASLRPLSPRHRLAFRQPKPNLATSAYHRRRRSSEPITTSLRSRVPVKSRNSLEFKAGRLVLRLTCPPVVSLT